MGRSQHTFQKRQREKAKAKKKIEKMEEREKRKAEKEATDNSLEIDWSAAPTDKTLEANGIDPEEVNEEEGATSENKDEQPENKDKEKSG